ncbi:MAG TPA: sporulation phosphorelay system protein KapB [Bacillota bacterium]|nr:sporulation phosphorelay system protein KapB [Bacillota bacterium]
MTDININDLVETSYNSGRYIGRVIEDRGNFFLIEVLAVTRHPQQGDLHNRGQVEGVAFHERKALAYREKTNARKRTSTKYTGEIPEYSESLKQAVEQMKEQLNEKNTPFNEASLQKLADLEEHFYHKIY